MSEIVRSPHIGVQRAPGVLFAGAQQSVWPWLAAADLVVAPSLREAGPISVMEGLAAGRAVVGTAVHGMRDLLPSDAIVAPADVEGLIAAIRDRLSTPSLCAREAVRGRDRVTSEYSFTTTAERIRALYSQLLPPAWGVRRKGAAGRPSASR